MFCEIHECLMDFRGCPKCAIEDSESFQAENGCEECGCSDFVGAKDGLLSCKECKTEHERIPDREGYLRRAYTSIYELFKRNSYYPYFWAKERSTSEIVYVLEIQELPTGIQNWNISNGVFVAKYNSKGDGKPIFRLGKGGKKYRPYVSGNHNDAGVDRSPLPKNYGFMFGEEFDEDWRMIEEPFNEPSINSTFQGIIDQAFDKYRTRNGMKTEMATESQKRYLCSKKLGYEGDVEKLTKRQASDLISRLSGSR